MLFACAVAVFSTNPPERLWGILAAGPYGLAALAALLAAGAAQDRRRGQPGRGADRPAGLDGLDRPGQPEVGVVIHSAALLLHQGTPYQAAHAGPPRTTRTSTTRTCPPWPCSGSRTRCSAAACSPTRGCGSGWCSCSGSRDAGPERVPRPWRWTAVVTASPIIAFPLTTGGDDLPVVALICVGLALLQACRPPRPALQPLPAPARAAPVLRIILAGLVLGLAAAMKATAWPALAVALALVAARDGKRAAGWLALAAIAVPIAVDGPVLFTQPAAVVSNTILFPLGLTKIKSPAASFLPGHLIAEAWGPGHLVAIGLVLLAGLGVAVSLVLRPPRDERAAGWRLVTGLVLMFAFAPASRFGYAVYPLGLACWLLLAAPAASGLISAYEAAPATSATAMDQSSKKQGPREQSRQE